MAVKRDMAVLVLNQVTARMDGIEGVEPVADNIMDYWSDYVIQLKIGRRSGQRIMKRLRPEGDLSEGKLVLTTTGFVADTTIEKK